MIRQPFFPKYGSNQILTAAAASAIAAIDLENKQVRIVNTGANIAYVQTFNIVDDPSVAATTADFPIASGQSSTITKGPNHNRIAYISAAGTTLQVMTGEGY